MSDSSPLLCPVRLKTLTGTPYVMYEDYTALFADRGRVLAAARELADAVQAKDEAVNEGEAADASVRIDAALASFREVDQ